MELMNKLFDAQPENRTMPFALNYPYRFEQTITVNIPPEWPVEEDNVNLTGPGYSFKKVVKGRLNTILIHFEYSTTKDHVSADSSSLFFQGQDDIRNNCSYFLFTQNENSNAGWLNWTTLILGLLVLGGSIYGFRQLYIRYSPPARSMTKLGEPIGGWLLLPAIGLVLGIGVQIYSIIAGSEWWRPGVWGYYLSSDSAFYDPAFAGYLFLYSYSPWPFWSIPAGLAYRFSSEKLRYPN